MDKNCLKICGRQFTVEQIQSIQQLIEQQPTMTRAALSRNVCDRLNWFRPDGRPKDMSCRVALIRLDRQGLITLPKPTRKIENKGNHRQTAIVEIKPITKSVDQIDNLALVPVNSSRPRLSKLWNSLIDQYHYLGYQPLVGAQLRYLIRSNDGWLGAMGFSAAAWKVAARDRYIGWTTPAREANLHYIVGNSRFLIMPWIHVNNLASKVLSLGASCIAQHWFDAYGYQPVLLESFVDKERFSGVCYQAANWQYVGDTRGRGKLDRNHKQALSIKKIYLYPLQQDFRQVLCRRGGQAS